MHAVIPPLAEAKKLIDVDLGMTPFSPLSFTKRWMWLEVTM
jgi:hypothetical protein